MQLSFIPLSDRVGRLVVTGRDTSFELFPEGGDAYTLGFRERPFFRIVLEGSEAPGPSKVNPVEMRNIDTLPGGPIAGWDAYRKWLGPIEPLPSEWMLDQLPNGSYYLVRSTLTYRKRSGSQGIHQRELSFHGGGHALVTGLWLQYPPQMSAWLLGIPYPQTKQETNHHPLIFFSFDAEMEPAQAPVAPCLILPETGPLVLRRESDARAIEEWEQQGAKALATASTRRRNWAAALVSRALGALGS